MSQDTHLQSDFSYDSSHIGGSDDDDNDGCLIESTVDSNRIDFGSRLHDGVNLGGHV